jgi:molecular chaperone HtpG
MFQPEAKTSDFEAEMANHMIYVIKSFYTNKENFLRELINNSSNALDMIRYESFIDPTKLYSGKVLNIKIIANKETGTLTIIDTGIGMTKADLINNFVTIADLNKTKFEDMLNHSSQVAQIRQSNVGFYSTYLIADEVTIHSKHNDEEQYVWKLAAGDSAFTIAHDQGMYFI